ncbi:hypothetical protein BJ546DRAFT_1026665 [Cryomyces antarcticus]
MPRRRPPGAAASLSTTLVALLFIIPLLATAQQQQPSQQNGIYRSPPEDPLLERARTHKRSQLAQLREQTTRQHFRDTATHISTIERALATIAPAGLNQAVEAPRAPPAKSARSSGGLSSRHPARSLQDWEVEDFVLLATVDGKIYARDRKMGAARWEFGADRPLVETTYHRQNHTEGGRHDDDFLWIVEPSQDGSLYVYTPGPNAGLQKLGLSVRQLVEELSPHAGEDPPVVYTAEKKNTLYTVDARSGKILKTFSSAGTSSINNQTCKPANRLDSLEDNECESTDTLTLGRTEYTVSIQDRTTGESICTIRYFEWVPNNRDKDLQSQYIDSMDNKYVYSKFDGSFFAMDHSNGNGLSIQHPEKPDYWSRLSSPVARVYDVARPPVDDTSDASLVILLQPGGPTTIGEPDIDDIFVNCTESGSWYAMSNHNYPTVTNGAIRAKVYNDDWGDNAFSWRAPASHKSRLVGVHSLSMHNGRRQDIPRIDAGGDQLAVPVVEDVSHVDAMPHIPSVKTSLFSTSELSRWFVVVFLALLFYSVKGKPSEWLSLLRPKAVAVPQVDSIVAEAAAQLTVPMNLDVEPSPTNLGVLPEPKAVRFADIPTKSDDAISQINDPSDVSQLDPGTGDTTITVPEQPSPDANSPGEVDAESALDEAEPPNETMAEKKKRKRGQRGGKKAREQREQQGKKLLKTEELDQNVGRVMQIDMEKPLQPNETTINGFGPVDTSKPIQINSLSITDRILGSGSGGTYVFEGTFEGRVVAVKRMLPQNYELASQEVSLLQQSDDHPNVIRYYCQQKDQHFLYIAVELCQASLWDLFNDDLGSNLASVKQNIEQDVPRALYQLAAGLNHLHSLRIIHRDIKPQNILIAYPKKNQRGARLVISDFGLCKTLPDNVSTLLGTTGNAGTCGWKAPELISMPKDVDGRPNSDSASRESIVSESNGTSQGGVKRAVDIFSLGCVFYYVMTDGAHPFDDGEGWMAMREFNIKKNKRDLSKLPPGDDTEEPLHLVSWMLEPRPEHRPSAVQVMQHPFFWSAERRLNFLCDVSDHWERECREPPSAHLNELERIAYEQRVFGSDFLAKLDRKFIDTLGKQRKYTGSRMLDLLRALRNKKNHYEDMPPNVKQLVGSLPKGYLQYWTVRFPKLLMACYTAVIQCDLQDVDRFRPYFVLSG